MDVHILNTLNMRWSLVPRRDNEKKYPEVPFQRYGHTAIAHKHFVYIWGGRNDELICNKLYCFDTRTLKWSRPEVHGQVPGKQFNQTIL